MTVVAGRVLSGRYRLDRLIARGGMGEVWEGYDERLGRTVAVKLLLPHLAADPDFVARFEQEARAAAALHHPNVVAIFDVGADGDLRFIVMEHVRGESLRALLRRAGAQPPARVVRIGAQLAAALAYAHTRGVIHRDVKPDNVLLTPDELVKVTDFGIARALGAASTTQTGVVLGTATYLSPEQARGEPATALSDVYALGVVLYELAAGRPPFQAENPTALLLKHATEPPLPPSHFNPAVPPELDAVILRALAKDPAERWGSAAVLEAALRDYQSVGAERTTRIGTVPVAARPPASSTQPEPVLRGAAAGNPRPSPVGAGRPADPSRAEGAWGAARPAPGTAARAAPRSGLGMLGGLLVLLLVVGLIGAALGLLYVLGSGADRPAPPPAPGGPQPTATAPAPPSPSVGPAILPTATPTAGPSPTPSPSPSPSPSPAATASPTPSPSPSPTPRPTATPTPARPTVPSVVGLSLQEAQQRLTAAGFKANAEPGPNEGPRGQVADQQPKGGTPADPGATVTIFVRRYVRVPDVVGMSEAEARKVLQANGLNPVVHDSPRKGKKDREVFSTDPPPYALVPRDSDVYLDVGR